MFCPPRLIFGGTEGVPSRFHVFLSQTCFRRYRGRSVPFSCLALPESFSVVPRASRPVFMFCAPGLIFRRYRGRRVSFSCFVQRLVFSGTEGIRPRFNVLRVRTHFRRYRGRRIPFSCFARPDLFSAVPRASHPVFMFSSPRHVFGDTEGVGSRFHILHSRTRFRRYRGRSVPFSCSALPDSFLVVPRACRPVLMFFAPGHVFDGTKGVGSRFHVLRTGLTFGGTEGVGSRFHVLHARTHFRPYRRHPGPVLLF
jgi:hypothetical protein